jgi:hypothetical protein
VVVENVLVYGPGLTGRAIDPVTRRDVQAEIARALAHGPGVAVFQQALGAPVVDAATAAFDRLIAAQRSAGTVAGRRRSPTRRRIVVGDVPRAWDDARLGEALHTQQARRRSLVGRRGREEPCRRRCRPAVARRHRGGVRREVEQ